MGLGIPAPWLMLIATTLMLFSFARYNRRTGFRRSVSMRGNIPDGAFTKSIFDQIVSIRKPDPESPEAAAPHVQPTMAAQLFLLSQSLQPVEKTAGLEITGVEDPAHSLQRTV